MAAGSEVKGSRKETTVLEHRTGICLFVSDDGTTGVPVLGDAYPATSESGYSACLKMKATKIDTDPTVIPGVYFHTVQYAAFRAF